MKKGFTLIELLAVIVILAIIALIATPIVLNIINESKESATLRSAEFYLKGVETSVASATLKNITISDGDYTIKNGDICLNEECTDKLKVDVDGKAPESGNVTIKKGQVENIVLSIDNKVIKKNNKGNLVFITPLVNYIKNLYKETKTTTVNGIEYSLDETNGLMNDRLGSSEVSKLDGNIRYYGSNPNNYIDIGDRDSEGNIIFWRIIGVFKDIEVTDENGNVIGTEDLVKIIRADKLTINGLYKFSWDYTSAGEYDKNWNTSTLQLMLNDKINGYYGLGTTIYYNRSLEPTTLNFSSVGLSSEAHNKVEIVNWSLGGLNTADVYTDAMYKYERSGTNSWSGKIALMYVSDYGYGVDLNACQYTLRNYYSESCIGGNWMYDSIFAQWTITPHSTAEKGVIVIAQNGRVGSNATDNVFSIRPVLYLKSDVGIVEEKETSEGLKYFVVG